MSGPARYSQFLSETERKIADLLGIQTVYNSNFGTEEEVSSAAFSALVKTLLSSEEQALSPEQLVETLERAQAEQTLAPFYIVESGSLRLEFASALKELPELRTEEGKVIQLEWDAPEKAVKLPVELPIGYHSLHLAQQDLQALLIVRPSKGRQLSDLMSSLKQHEGAKGWGCFLPLYSVFSEQTYGAADYSDLLKITERTSKLGASTVATLPLLPTFLSEWKEDPSPYSAVSRLFWNEFYVDPRQSPEWSVLPEVRQIWDEGQEQADEWKKQAHVPYAKVFAFKMKVLSKMAQHYFAEGDPTRLQKLLKTKHDIVQYARFRAYSDHFGESWHCWDFQWNNGKRSGDLPPLPECKELEQTYLYAQLLACEQMQVCAKSAQDARSGFYLDLPVGVHSDGYDVYRNQDAYCLGLSAGAPPDPVFVGGQSWGFPPLHPRNLVRKGWRHFAEVLRHHFEHANLLRVDHVMGLHRIYVIPHGFGADEGAYITFPHELLYGILMVEAERAGAAIVGENLGTVPEQVNHEMNRRALAELYVLQYSLGPEKKPVSGHVPSESVASINTHDMPCFKAYRDGLDWDDSLDLGWIDLDRHARSIDARKELILKWVSFLKEEGLLEDGAKDNSGLSSEGSSMESSLEYADFFAASMRWLFSSPAEIALLNVEDLWGEDRPQNVPGTYKERANWLRRMAFSVEQWWEHPAWEQFCSKLVPLRD